jgi:hypothetical protein
MESSLSNGEPSQMKNLHAQPLQESILNKLVEPSLLKTKKCLEKFMLRSYTKNWLKELSATKCSVLNFTMHPVV